MDSLYIVIPAYNESENLDQLIYDWYPVIKKHNGDGKSRLMIIDDGSKDNTYEKIQKLAETRPLLVPVTKINGGHGDTVLYGYRRAVNAEADYIFQTDSDGQTLASEFEQFWLLRKEYDAVIGKRLVRGDGKDRAFVEKVLCLMIGVIFGVSLPDSNAPFRLMKRELLARYLSKLPDGYNLPNVMLTTMFAYYHERITFEEITFRPRQKGTNAINIQKIVKIGWKALGDFIGFAREMRKG